MCQDYTDNHTWIPTRAAITQRRCWRLSVLILLLFLQARFCVETMQQTKAEILPGLKVVLGPSGLPFMEEFHWSTFEVSSLPAPTITPSKS